MSFEVLYCIVLALFAAQSIVFLLLMCDAATQLKQLSKARKTETQNEFAAEVPERIKRQFENLMNYDGTASKQVSVDDD